jgi:hypothetical protein
LAIGNITQVGHADDPPAPAPEPTPTKSPIEIATEQEQQRAALAKARKERLEAERDAREAELPTVRATPLEGTTSVDGLTLEANVMAFQAMSEASKKISRNIQAHIAARPASDGIKTIVIHSDADAAALLNYRVFGAQANYFIQEYLRLLNKEASNPDLEKARGTAGIAVTAAAVGGAIQSVVDVVALFRTNTEIKNVTVDAIDEATFVAAIGENMAKQNPPGVSRTQIYYPALFPINTQADTNEALPIIVFLNQMQALRAEAERAIKDAPTDDEPSKALTKAQARLNGLTATITAKDAERQAKRNEVMAAQQRSAPQPEMAALNAQLLTITRELNKLTADKRQLDSDIAYYNTAQYTANLAELPVLNENFDKFLGGLFKVDDAGAASAFTNLVRASLLSAKLREQGCILHVKVVRQGGSFQKKDNLYTKVATGSRLSFSGGVVVHYILFDKNGAVQTSGMVPQYFDYRSSKRLMEQ